MQVQALEFVKAEHLDYLDDLREVGSINMHHARPYLVREFPDLSSQEAALVLSHWLQCNPDYYLSCYSSAMAIS